MPKYLTILFYVALVVPGLFAQSEFVTVHSVSKQFVVYGPKTGRVASGNHIALDPALLVVSCERIKQAVLSELGEAEHGRFNFSREKLGNFYVVIHPRADQKVVITPINHPGNLSYRIDLPNQIETPHLIETITQVVLLELVNRRSAPENFTRIPRWLTQGISAQVLSSTPDALVLQRNLRISTTKQRNDPMVRIRKRLQNFEPLTFDELSWPETLHQERFAHFEECAQLFVHELLALKNGKACLKKMLDELPNHLNWQIAFLRGFQPHFKQLVDVEKWWSLRLVNLTGRDIRKLWPRAESIERIDAALNIPVQVHEDADAMPSRRVFTLQEIVFGWEPAQQQRALQKVVSQLHALRMRVHPEAAVLLDEYRLTLDTFLANSKKRAFLKSVFVRDDSEQLAQNTRDRLDALDGKRAELRRKSQPNTREEAIRSALEIAGKEPSR